MATKSLQLMSWFFGQSAPRTAINVLVLSLSMFGFFWTFLEAAGVPGSPKIIVLLAAIIAVLVCVILMVFWLSRWALLYPAIREYVRDNLAGRVIDNDTVLVTAGTGGTIALGMVAKALQELGYPVSKTLALNLEYRENGTSEVGGLLPNEVNLANTPSLIVVSYTGTGSCLRAIRNRLKIDDAPAFSLAISNAAKGRERVEYYMIVGSRAIIPWKRSTTENTMIQRTIRG